MLPLALTISAAALILLAIALRGRTTARGRFCRRCKFDLQGLDHPSTCPECGRDLTAPGSTRPALRRAHKPAIAVSLVLLLAAGGMTALALNPRGPAFYAGLPDSQIVLLNRFGIDETLTELAARATRTPAMSDAHWRTIVQRGLAHQADTATPWDPRWGDVLGQAFVQNRMTKDQIRDYTRQAFELAFTVRDRIVHDAERIGCRVAWTPGRITTAGADITTPARYSLSTTQSGIMGGGEPRRGAASIGGEFVIPSQSVRSRSSSGSTINIGPISPGVESVRVYLETRFTLQDADGNPIIEADQTRYEQAVRILPPGEAVVQLLTDPDAANAIRDKATLSVLTITATDAAQFPAWGAEVGSLQINFLNPPKALAGRLYAVLDSVEFELGTVALPAGSGHFGHGIGIQITPSDADAQLKHLRELASRATVDVIFRTDPSVANNDPRIDQVVDLMLLFPDVPVSNSASQGASPATSHPHTETPAARDP